MKQFNKPSLAATFITMVLVAVTFLLSSFQARYTEDVWKLLGMSRQSGTENIKSSFTNGFLDYYGARNLKNIAMNDRGAIAKDLLEYTKQYISSDVFKKYYETMRKDARPEEPVKKPLRTTQEIQKEEIAKTEKSIKDTEKSMKELGGDVAKSLQPVLDMLKKNLKDFQNPNHQFFSSIALGEKYQQEDAARRYSEDMKRWEKEFPENVNQYVKTKLQMMLDYTKDIDYNAALVEKYGKKRFVNPAYEGKRTEWKQGFRAGKAVTETARAFAQEWMKSL